jgi:Ca2+:H+ antiporter
VTRFQKSAFSVVFALAALALALRVADVAGQIVFVVAGVAVAGLAWALGEATEQAGESAGPRASALLNASFGYLPELVILVLAIDAGLTDIARASIIGSVIGNVLLILGLALMLGGWRHGIQRFNERVANTNASMLILGVVGLGIPTLFQSLAHDMGSELVLSRWTGAALLLCYVAYVYFSFTTPGLQFVDEPGQVSWTRRQAIVLLALTAVATGVVSEVLVHSIQATITAWGVPRQFIGLIVVPFVGNVAEHFSAVKLALSNRMDFAMGIAYGSGIQISLLASGVAVFASMLIGNDLALVFNPLQLAALGAAAIGSTMVARAGETNWLEGLQLVVIYFVVAVAFWLLG